MIFPWWISFFQIPWFFNAWNFFWGDFPGFSQCMELLLVIFQVFHDFQSLWEPWYEQLNPALITKSLVEICEPGSEEGIVLTNLNIEKFNTLRAITPSKIIKAEHHGDNGFGVPEKMQLYHKIYSTCTFHNVSFHFKYFATFHENTSNSWEKCTREITILNVKGP